MFASFLIDEISILFSTVIKELENENGSYLKISLLQMLKNYIFIFSKTK